ncbi:hypothetical protein DL96DRAFT_1714960 [Flagelloscypha sp. PMI_526]|nr:hypothetical protein DL96DRAFT_1714960 [Flagelloscypha sp. PMI_526]
MSWLWSTPDPAPRSTRGSSAPSQDHRSPRSSPASPVAQGIAPPASPDAYPSSRTRHGTKASGSQDRLLTELSQLKTENQKIKQNNITLERRVDAHTSTINDLRGKLSESEKNQRNRAHHSLQEIQNLQSSLQNTQNLLAAKTHELVSAELFLSSTDDDSVADARKELEALNHEIFQFAALLSETLAFERPLTISETARTRGIDLLEFDVCRLLHSADAEKTSLIIQVSIQSLICRVCTTIISSWCIDKPRLSADLRRLYDAFCRNGPSQIAGTWRTITRSHIHPPETFTVENFQLVDQFSTPLIQLLRVLGWNKHGREARDALLSEYRDRLVVICSATMKINKLFGEHISSVDLEIKRIQGGDEFDPSRMVDEYEENGVSQVVFGTTDLGIVQGERQDGKGVPNKRFMLMKPKVVLVSTLEN